MESRRSPLLPEAMDHEPGLLNAAGHAQEIAVGRLDADAYIELVVAPSRDT